jgi:hypothetical protein
VIQHGQWWITGKGVSFRPVIGGQFSPGGDTVGGVITVGKRAALELRLHKLGGLAAEQELKWHLSMMPDARVTP